MMWVWWMWMPWWRVKMHDATDKKEQGKRFDDAEGWTIVHYQPMDSAAELHETSKFCNGSNIKFLVLLYYSYVVGCT